MLYHRDAYRRRFQSQVGGLRTWQGSLWVWLLDTAFYPTGGGQPCDLGTLEIAGRAFSVTEVTKDGQVWHRLEGPAAGEVAVGDPAVGELDWPRRLRHMQRHSAQHLLAQAFSRVDRAFSVLAINLSQPRCTMDLAGHPDPAAIQAASALLHAQLYRDLPITSFEVEESELDRFPLRRPPQVQGRVRLVAVADPEDPSGFWDVSACGGTHLSSAAQAIPVTVLRGEAVRKGGTRVYFLAGEEARCYLEEGRVRLQALAARFSCRDEEVPERVLGLAEQLADQQAELRRLRLREAGLRLASVQSHPLPGAALRYLSLRPEEEDLLDALATLAADLPPALTVVSAGSQLLVASSCAISARALLAALLADLGGKGGGSDRLARGSADLASLRALSAERLAALAVP